jgi:hypothetical protein
MEGRTIRISRTQVGAALPKVREGLDRYLWLQAQIASGSSAWEDRTFRRRFNRFYRVRRGRAWQDTFYGLMGRAAREQLQFRVVLDLLHDETTRYEASFVSKLIATLSPALPVIDSFVLKNLGLRLPRHGALNRAARITQVYEELAGAFAPFLATTDGRYLVDRFRAAYPKADITEVKMVDFVLWQTRTSGGETDAVSAL